MTKLHTAARENQMANCSFKPIGQLVVVKDDRLPSSKWRFGQVTELHSGKNEMVRVVTLKYASCSVQ